MICILSVSFTNIREVIIQKFVFSVTITISLTLIVPSTERNIFLSKNLNVRSFKSIYTHKLKNTYQTFISLISPGCPKSMTII